MNDCAPPTTPSPIQSPSTWRQMVNSAIDTAIIGTEIDGRVVSWSEGARRLLGWTEAEMLGQDLSRLFTDEDRAAGKLSVEMAEALAQGRGGGEEGWRLRKDGSRFWAVGELAPIRHDDGRHIGFVKVLRDRTRQKRAEEDLGEERRALAILNRAGSALALETDLQRVVQVVTDAGVELTGAEFGAFFYNVLDETGESYTLYTLSGAPQEAFARFPMPRNTSRRPSRARESSARTTSRRTRAMGTTRRTTACPKAICRCAATWQCRCSRARTR